MSQERTLIGCTTYVAGDYHFNKGVPLMVEDEHLATLDAIEDRNGDPMFSSDAPKAERKSVTISKGGKKQEAKNATESSEETDQTATV